MITLYNWDEDSIIVHDKANVFPAEELNNIFLKIVGDSQRVIREGEYVFIGGHQNLRYESFKELVKKFLIKTGLSYNWSDTLTDEQKHYFISNNLAATSDPSKGARGGGAPKDTSTIEPGIALLVTALNLFEGIQTFGSCEGHPPNPPEEGRPNRAYVTWIAHNLDGLNYSTCLLKTGINKVVDFNDPRFSSRQMTNRINLEFNTGYWTPDKYVWAPMIGENYYEFTFTYMSDLREIAFNYMNDIAHYMMDKRLVDRKAKWNLRMS